MTSQSAPALPGMEAGHRKERTEWGLRSACDTALNRKGHVEPRESEEHARTCAGRVEYGWRGTEVVCRTVVTYTTAWEVPGDRRP